MEQFLITLNFTAAIVALIYLFKFNSEQKLSIRSWIFSILAIILIPFGFSWAVTSFYEFEPQAAWLGILVFSGLGAVFAYLAWQQMFPNEKNFFKNIEYLGLKITVIVLLVIGVLTVPMTIVIKKTINNLDSKEKIVRLISENIIADETFPFFIKKSLAYETRYGELPEKVEIRLMQSILSGVKDEEFVKLFDLIIPESEREILLTSGSKAVSEWLNGEAAYPEFQLNPRNYIFKAEKNVEEIARWIYRNFSLPPMSDSIANNFEKGIFSENIQDYLGTPPEHLKASLISPFAGLIRTQLKTVEVPEVINLKEEMAKNITKEEMIGNKEKFQSTISLINNIWIIPSLLHLIGLLLIIFSKKFKRLPWLAWAFIAFGIRCMFCGFTFGDITGLLNNLIPTMAENAPAPILALVHNVLPSIISTTGSDMMTLMWVHLLIGSVMLAIAYNKKIKEVVMNK